MPIAICRPRLLRQGFATALTHSWLDAWIAFARPFRMPDFFLLSGLFLGRVIDRPWRGYLDRKVMHYLYFFVLWTVILFIARAGSGFAGDDLEAVARSLLQMLVEPFAMLWFIEMLAIFFVVTRLTRRVPVWLMLPLAAALQIIGIESDWSPLRHFAERYVYFYAGYALAPALFALAAGARAHRRLTLLALAAWAVVNGTLVQWGVHEARGLALVLGFAGASAVIAVGSLLSELKSMNWLRYLGQHSMVVYLGFYLPMSAANFWIATHRWSIEPGITAVVVVVASIACAVLLERFTRMNAGRYLFVRPTWARLESPAGAKSRGIERGTV